MASIGATPGAALDRGWVGVCPMQRTVLALSSALLLALAACSAEDSTPPQAPAPPSAEKGPGVGADAYSVGIKIRRPGVTGHFDCDDGGLCWCVGDAACNEMFEDLPCNTLNSWCNQELDKCFCDLEGGSYKDYQ